MGGKVDHPFKVEVWEGDKVAETLAVAGSVIVAGAAYEAAVGERPGRVVTLRHGARVIRTNEPAKPPPATPPTIGQLRALGVTGVRLWCVGCGRHAVLTWEALKARDEEPFPTAGHRPACTACGGRQVQRMPDWPRQGNNAK
ncbi:MAG: hypothetical protein Q8O26_08285 [Phreatobacter sp.]|uniref:hypothetical protein n=1 Tax=Phreatobacter sp. TaxID=1966341 RepID=UPI0027373B8A|nr:hypothetical protein [Phreatobacter sp.]MDP2801865.1 hypothetical protein [Phreatobacter sp.]